MQQPARDYLVTNSRLIASAQNGAAAAAAAVEAVFAEARAD